MGERPKCIELAAEVVQYVVLRWGKGHADVVGDADFYSAVARAAETIYGDQATIEQLEKDHQAIEALRARQIESVSWIDQDIGPDWSGCSGCWQAWAYGRQAYQIGRRSFSADPADAIRAAVELQKAEAAEEAAKKVES